MAPNQIRPGLQVGATGLHPGPKLLLRVHTEGFRGVIARDFTFAALHRLAEGYGRHLMGRGGGLVVVGHDTRFLAEAFARALAGHLSGMGLKAVLLRGPVPTPLLSFAVRHLEAAGGAMLTASHNPPQYLGVKFKDHTGGPIAQEEARAIEALVPEEAWPREGSYEVLDLKEAYFEALKAHLDLRALSAFPGALYHDSMGGAGAGFLRGFFRHVGLEVPVKPIREEPHPLFHGVNPEPIPKNLGVTLAVMGPEAPPTFAVATDGDADRVGVVLPGGVFFNPHQVLTALALYRFRQGHRGRAVKNFAVTWLLDRLGERLGFGVTTTPVGFKWIKEAFLKGDCFLGGGVRGRGLPGAPARAGRDPHGPPPPGERGRHGEGPGGAVPGGGRPRGPHPRLPPPGPAPEGPLDLTPSASPAPWPGSPPGGWTPWTG